MDGHDLFKVEQAEQQVGKKISENVFPEPEKTEPMSQSYCYKCLALSETFMNMQRH